MTCLCGDDDCMYFAMEYPYCRPHDEHHRLPECDIDEQGRVLLSCGHVDNDEPCPCWQDMGYIEEATS